MSNSSQATSTPPTPPNSGAPGGGSLTVSAPPRPSRGGGRTVVVAAIVVVVVVVAGLILTGIIPLLPGSSSSSGVATPSYSSAESSAAAVAGSAPGHPWTPVFAEGLDLIHSYSNSTPIPGCPFTGGSDTLSFAAYGGNYSNGQLSNWVFVYVNSAATSELAVQVSGGTASEIGTVSVSSTCHLSLAPVKPLGNNVVDSTHVATTLLGSAVVESFVHSYSTANAVYALVTIGSEGLVWTVTYSGCPITGYGGGAATGATVEAELNASTGEIVGTVYSSPSSTSCSGGSHGNPIGSAFAVGNPTTSMCPSGDTWANNGCVAGDNVYILTIESSTITLADVLFEVKTATGAIADLPGAQGFSIWNITGGTVAESSTSSPILNMTGWSFPSGSHFNDSSPLTTLYTIWIDVGTTSPVGLGYAFVALGQGSYTGTTNPVTLP